MNLLLLPMPLPDTEYQHCNNLCVCYQKIISRSSLCFHVYLSVEDFLVLTTCYEFTSSQFLLTMKKIFLILMWTTDISFSTLPRKIDFMIYSIVRKGILRKLFFKCSTIIRETCCIWWTKMTRFNSFRSETSQVLHQQLTKNTVVRNQYGSVNGCRVIQVKELE